MNLSACASTTSPKNVKALNVLLTGTLTSPHQPADSTQFHDAFPPCERVKPNPLATVVPSERAQCQLRSAMYEPPFVANWIFVSYTAMVDAVAENRIDVSVNM